MKMNFSSGLVWGIGLSLMLGLLASATRVQTAAAEQAAQSEKQFDDDYIDGGYIADIRIFAFNFAPRGTRFCDGSLLAISSNSALFSILGTTYGGDGRTTFGLPDLRGRLALHTTRGYTLGAKAGSLLGSTPALGGKDVQVAAASRSDRAPYAVLNYCIITEGLFPSRN